MEHHNIVDDLKYVQYLKYKPHFGKEKELSHKDVIFWKSHEDCMLPIVPLMIK